LQRVRPIEAEGWCAMKFILEIYSRGDLPLSGMKRVTHECKSADEAVRVCQTVNKIEGVISVDANAFDPATGEHRKCWTLWCNPEEVFPPASDDLPPFTLAGDAR
jgi:hypothetical protein